jgi:hypothetical protein
MAPAARLQLRLLIGADHVLVGPQPLALKDTVIEIEHTAGLLGEQRVAREDPRAGLPRLDRILVQPAPDRRRRSAGSTPRSITSRCSSTRENLESGKPLVAGSSQAIALTSAICCGGKTARATRARLVLEPFQPIIKEPSSPLPHDPGGGVQPDRDLGVRDTARRVEHDPRALHVLERQLLRPRTPRQLNALFLGERDPVLRRACHRNT